MAEEIAFENKRISNTKGLVTFILILDQVIIVIMHTIVHHSLTDFYVHAKFH